MIVSKYRQITIAVLAVVSMLTIVPAQSNYVEQGQKQPPVTKETMRQARISDIEVSRSNGNTNKQVQKLTVESTSYSHTGSRTYSNTWPKEGVTVAVDGKVIRVGSWVYIQELNNWYLAEDKIPIESVRKGAVIDIFMNREADCWTWGRRDVAVIVVGPN